MRLGRFLFPFAARQTRLVALGTAERIARSAQDFGQEDDITLVTLTRRSEGPQVVQLRTSAVFEKFA